jgi:hypothetical protein
MMRVTNINVNEFSVLRWHEKGKQEEAVADAFLETDVPFRSGKLYLLQTKHAMLMS